MVLVKQSQDNLRLLSHQKRIEKRDARIIVLKIRKMRMNAESVVKRNSLTAILSVGDIVMLGVITNSEIRREMWARSVSDEDLPVEGETP